MIYIAKKSFSGIVSAIAGNEVEIKDEKVIKDLLKAGYIEEKAIPSPGSPVPKNENEPENGDDNGRGNKRSIKNK